MGAISITATKAKPDRTEKTVIRCRFSLGITADSLTGVPQVLVTEAEDRIVGVCLYSLVGANCVRLRVLYHFENIYQIRRAGACSRRSSTG